MPQRQRTLMQSISNVSRYLLVTQSTIAEFRAAYGVSLRGFDRHPLVLSLPLTRWAAYCKRRNDHDAAEISAPVRFGCVHPAGRFRAIEGPLARHLAVGSRQVRLSTRNYHGE